MNGGGKVTSLLASRQTPVMTMSRGDEEDGPILRHHQRYGATEAPEQGSVESGRGAEDDVIEGVAMIPSYRLLVALIAQLGLVGSFASQSIMGASLLTMVGNVTNATSDTQWHYPWDTKTQTWILAVFFSGYYVIQIPAGLMTHRVGGKRVAVWGAVSLAVLQGVSIYVPRFGPSPFLVTMALAGVANGCMYVPLLDVLARWVPPQESSTLVNLAVSGVGIGIAFVYGLSAFTSELQLFGGWPFNFMALGVLLLVFAVLLWVLVSDKPEQCAFISAKERHYIISSQKRHNPANQSSNVTGYCGVPWRQIVTSGPVLAIAASQFGTDWIQYFFMTLFPLYLKHARGMHTATVSRSPSVTLTLESNMAI
ncbi:hypothetical protein V1264_002506 [Littorina saxatilis]|uniref:Major facilitator superfamily (MFS) profile domain-containing protein n=1 Tax=Littorina saxatilis TaxID=31220 RepID=A0AAN9G7I4_9CAEN